MCMGRSSLLWIMVLGTPSLHPPNPHPHSIQAMPTPTGSSRGSPWADEGEAWESKALEDGEGISAAMVLGKKVEGGGPLSREELSLISPFAWAQWAPAITSHRGW